MNLTILIGVIGSFVFSLVFIALMQIFKEWHLRDMLNTPSEDNFNVIEINYPIYRKKVSNS